MTTNNKGKISQVIGAVVDVTFEENIPPILGALECKVGDKTITLEVANTLVNLQFEQSQWTLLME
jgi:F-type H+-transporting ATPase subunit beta